ncbi:hypothetical protein BROUX41_005224 [Berkeleyomyces rouxiae]|uniref:uncharacterized protein n=1 Tax=Berkeleyomyces rouxiae TaxID=2035830 RepID=UPI003B7FAB70
MSTTVMAYQYESMPPSAGTDAADMPQPTFGYDAQSQGPSTPQYSTDSGTGQQSGERRRNKLGYHRTSVACGHCRRRKIRCILSNDSNGRCANCIRLKKECTFYPVDQPPPDARGRPGTSSQSASSNRGNCSQSTQGRYSSTGLPISAMAPSMAEREPNGGTVYDYTTPTTNILPNPTWRGFMDESGVASPSTYRMENTDPWPNSNTTDAPGDASAWYTQSGPTRDSYSSFDGSLNFDRRSSVMSDYQTSIGSVPLSSPVYEQRWQDQYSYPTRHDSVQLDQWVGFNSNSPNPTAATATGTIAPENASQSQNPANMYFQQ